VQYEELDRGSKGDFVSDVQQRLKELFFYNGNITGKYDTETQKAFKQFEKYNNLTNDGKASQSDLLILFNDKWAALECKQHAGAKKQPNQEYYVGKMDEMSFSRFICPENKEEVLHDLQQSFQS
jgi:peptidoglycan hydrolase-like protein with peptidoglycan-binding domain